MPRSARTLAVSEQQTQTVEDNGGGAAFVSQDAEPEGDLGDDADDDHRCSHAKSDEHVLPHDADRAAAQFPCVEKGVETVAGKDEIRLFAGSVGPAEAHGDADIRGSQGRGVVDAVADHGDMAAFGLEALDDLRFLSRQESGVDFLDARDFRDRYRSPVLVANIF